uniref:Uncharacterized protein n=1 Tax=Oryzias latipes TaxID=8090 RepID=A0A3P9MQW2_ORYLA
MMRESGMEVMGNGPASQNGRASVEGAAKEGRPRSGTPSVDVTAMDLLHLQQHQILKIVICLLRIL